MVISDTPTTWSHTHTPPPPPSHPPHTTTTTHTPHLPHHLTPACCPHPSYLLPADYRCCGTLLPAFLHRAPPLPSLPPAPPAAALHFPCCALARLPALHLRRGTTRLTPHHAHTLPPAALCALSCLRRDHHTHTAHTTRTRTSYAPPHLHHYHTTLTPPPCLHTFPPPACTTCPHTAHLPHYLPYCPGRGS